MWKDRKPQAGRGGPALVRENNQGDRDCIADAMDDGGPTANVAPSHRGTHFRLRYRRFTTLSPPRAQPSSQGSNLQALIDALNTPALPHAQIVLVLSNRKAAYGLTRAQNAQPPIRTACLALQPYLKANPEKTRPDYDLEVAKLVIKENPDIVVLAGWMHIMSEGFLDAVNGDTAYEGEEKVQKPIPVINLHPALPGAFDGAHAIERAYEAFQRGEIAHSGAMVHRVVREVDRGEPVIVQPVEIKPGEPIEAFEERLHQTEWGLIVKATAKVLDEVAPISIGP
ncbi:phosphoribosylglycinamide formyltransferase [Trametopsis cervina]|nr:phosphoribosylglycinamide formyltransferase [Trametopsis cervina]